MGETGPGLTKGRDDVRRTWWRLLAALAAVTVVAAACSSDRSDDPTGHGEGDGNSETTAPPEDAASDHFGTLASPCGEGDASAATRASPTTRSSSATATTQASACRPASSHETSDAIARP